MRQSFQTISGKSVTLEDRLGGGGEGDVWKVQGRLEVAKIYHPQVLKPGYERKLSAMVANPPVDEMRVKGHISIAWPTELLYREKKFAGFLMPLLEKSPTIFTMYNPVRRQKTCPGFNWQYLIHTALNLSIAIDAIHSKKYLIGDINESNILVKPIALVSVIDTDSFQVVDADGYVHRCLVGKEEYTPPELHGVSLDKVNRLPEHDYFGLGVLIFRLLMEGYYPFAGVMKENIQYSEPEMFYCLRRGAFPYIRNSIVSPPPLAPRFDTLPPDVQKLMLRCFVAGHRHPKSRPSPREWVEVLEKVEKNLAVCLENKEHIYSQHLKKCPWCEREQNKSTIKFQTPLPPVRVLPSAPRSAANLSSAPVAVPVKPVSSSSPRASAPQKTSRPPTRKPWTKVRRFFYSPRGHLDQHLWWGGIRRPAIFGLAGGVGLFTVFILMTMYPAIAGFAAGILAAGMVLVPVFFVSRYLYFSPNPRGKLMGGAIMLLSLAAAGILGVQVFQAGSMIFAEIKPQMLWLFIDSLLLGVIGGAVYGNFRVVSKYIGKGLAWIFSGAMLILPLVLMAEVGLFSLPFRQAQTVMPVNVQPYEACDGALLPSRLRIGDRAVLSEGKENNLRDEAGKLGGNTAIIGKIFAGDQVEILAGPQCADQMVWWQVKVIRADQRVGWTAEFGVDGEEPAEYWLIPVEP